MFKKISLSIFLVIILAFFSVNAVSADGIVQPPTGSGSILDKGSSYASGNLGNYSLNDLLNLGIRVSELILGLVGSVSLLMFIWGGFQWLISGGDSNKITAGKKIMINAIIGIIVVFSSYIIIQFIVVNLLGMSWSGGFVSF
jgi:hypothetical protein